MLFFIICIMPLFGYLHACPQNAIITPCECRNIFNSDVMTCAGLLNPDELVKPITAVAERRSPIEIMVILNSTLLYIPNSIFKGATFEKIHVINSEVMSFSDTDIAFEGLENSLIELRATQASYVTHWDWKQLRNLKSLELIDVANVELGSISTRFPALKNLRFLGITNAHIYFIIQYAFADLIDLTVLNLKGNEISEVKRNMFPEPANNLISVDLRESIEIFLRSGNICNDSANVELVSISTQFPALKNLKFLGITNANIYFIIQYEFADLIDLTVLNLKGNEIAEVNRNMFPEPAYNLIFIDLSENELSHLPEDIFRNMPVLESVILDNNKFNTLDRKVFSWAFTHLTELAMFGNKFVCDCKMKWMIGGHVPLRFTGECDSPDSLKGKPIRILQFEEIHC